MKNKSLSFLQTAIAGVSGLIVAEVFNGKGIFHLVVMVIGFVVVSVLCEIAFAVLAEKINTKKLKIIGWILFVVLVVILSYFKSKNTGYFSNF